MWSVINAAAVALPFAVCAAQPTAPPPRSVTTGDAANGTTVRLEPGQALVLRLGSNRTTGYSWSLAPDSSARLSLDSSGYEPPAPPAPGQPAIAGAGGTEVLIFTQTGAGTGELKLAYRRSWRPDDPPARSFSLTIVTPAP